VSILRRGHVRLRVVSRKVITLPRGSFSKSASTLVDEIHATLDEYACDTTIAEVVGVLKMVADDISNNAGWEDCPADSP
jgi:hypothetical protein